MPLSSYAQTALKAPVATPSSGAAPLSSYAQAQVKGTSVTTPDTQNYQTAFANTPAPPAPPPSFMQNLGTSVRDGLQSVWSAPAPAKVAVTPQSYLTDIYGTKTPQGIQGGIVGDTLNAWNKAVTDFQATNNQPAKGSGRLIGLTQAGLDAVQAFFQPVSTVFSEAATIPGFVGDTANFVNKIFSSVGVVGGDTLGSMVQSAPMLSDEQKAKLAPIAQGIGALGAQIIAGKGGEQAFTGLKDSTHQFLSTLQEDARLKALNSDPNVQAAIQKQTQPTKQLPVTSETPTESPVKVNTPMTKMSDYANKMGYEPITPDSQLPTIDMGKGAKSDIPTIQANAPASNDLGGGMKLVPEPPPSTTAPVEPITPPTEASPPETQNVPSTAPEAPKSVPSPYVTTPAVERPVAEDGTRVTKAASDINQHLVNEGISELPPEQQAKYTSGSYKDSKAQADIMAGTDRASLNEMAITGKDIPAGVHPQILFNTVRDLAKAEKDYPLLQQLADSPLATERSQAASTMGSAGYGQDKGANAVIDALQRAKEAKSGGTEGKAKNAAAVKEAKTTITKTAAKMMDYNKIIDAIKSC